VRATERARGLRIKFVGMMGYITRSDGSLLVVLPGEHRIGHYSHVPFLMARKGSAVARALELTPMPGVVPGAFDMALADAAAGSFAFRCLDGLDLEVLSRTAATGVVNRASQLAQMNQIAPHRRLRANLRRWAQATITIDSGTLDNSAAHPDAGKVWSFGSHRQRLTDAVLYQGAAATIRLSAGLRVSTFEVDGARPADLWVVSAAGPRTDAPDPKRLEHAHLLFEYFADAQPIAPTCEAAEGRLTVATELPCTGGFASAAGGAARVAPPYSELCPGGGWE
jgi:hypothetical protein